MNPRMIGTLWVAACLLSSCNQQPDNKPLVAGEQLYTKNCKVCHAQGINGAPILGNKKMWRARTEQPLSTLVEHAANGFGLMPAKGGNDALTDNDIEQAIGYMLSALQP